MPAGGAGRRATAETTTQPSTTTASATPGAPAAAITTAATASTMSARPAKLPTPARQRPIHSHAMPSAATATRAAQAQLPIQMQISPSGASTAAESTRVRRSLQALFRGTGISAGTGTEPPLAPAELGQGLAEMRRAEIGPEHVHEDELGIGALPEQEIRKPLLAAGSDHEIRVGHPVGEEQTLESRLVELRRVEPPFRHRRRTGA